MLPRLPPLLLALLGGASVYGIKVILDRLEPKAIGPPGSSEHAERLHRYRTFVRRGTLAAAASGVAYAGYWLYDKRVHRPTPAALSDSPENEEAFHQDQYRDRERRLQQETEKLREAQRQREQLTRQRLHAEQVSMETLETR